MIDLEFMLENDEILNELYVGETPFIKDLIEEISRARSPYVGKLKRPIKGNKDFIRIGDMIAEEFGFKTVTFMVPYDTSMNVFTYPITNSFDKSIYGIQPKFNKETGLKYNNSGLSIIVAVTAGVWFSKEITDREVVAAMLHEIGHSFVLQSERMIDIIETNRVALITMLIYQIVIDIYSLQFQRVPDDIKTIINSSNKGKEIINKVTRECANNPLFIGFNGINTIKEYITGVVNGIFKEISSLLDGPISIMTIPIALINKIFSILYKQDTAVSRSQEYLSDSFASMYGLGPEISTFLAKIEYSPSSSGSYIDKFISITPIIGALHQSMKLPILMIMNGITTHPSTPARMDKIIQELNKELKDSDLNPKTKEELKKNIYELEKIKDEFISTSNSKNYNAEMVKRFWISYISNKGEVNDEIENYYTDLDKRNQYTRESCINESNLFNTVKINKFKLVDRSYVEDLINRIEESTSNDKAQREKYYKLAIKYIDELKIQSTPANLYMYPDHVKDSLLKEHEMMENNKKLLIKNMNKNSSYPINSSIYGGDGIKIGSKGSWYALAANGIKNDKDYESIQHDLKSWSKNNYNDFKNTSFEDAIEEIAFAKYDISKMMKFLEFNKGDTNYVLDDMKNKSMIRVLKDKTLTQVISFDSEYIVYCHEDNCCYIFSAKHEDGIDKVSLSQVINAANRAYKDLQIMIKNYKK